MYKEIVVRTRTVSVFNVTLFFEWAEITRGLRIHVVTIQS
jgi:hypothetical protein